MRLRSAGCVVVVMAIALALPAPALAHRTEASERSRRDGISREIERIEDELGDLGAEEHELAHRLEDARARRFELDERLGLLEREIASVEADLALVTQQLAAAQADVTRAKRKLALARLQLRDARREVRDSAVAAYVSNPGGEIAGAVFEARDVRELGARTAYARAVVQSQARIVDNLRVARDDASAARHDHEAALAAAVDARDTIAVQRADLEERRHAEGELRTAALAHEREEQALLAEVQERRAGHETRLAALRRESDAISSFLRSVQAGQAITIRGTGQLALPITGARLSSRFGPRVHPIFGTERLHSGVDWAAATGTPVRAAGAGRVVHAGDRGGYGNAVIIDHGGSLATLYAHLSVVTVPSGGTVQRGQVIGAVGSTGFSTGPHLHFEVRVAGSPVDPLPYL